MTVVCYANVNIIMFSCFMFPALFLCLHPPAYSYIMHVYLYVMRNIFTYIEYRCYYAVASLSLCATPWAIESTCSCMKLRHKLTDFSVVFTVRLGKE